MNVEKDVRIADDGRAVVQEVVVLGGIWGARFRETARSMEGGAWRELFRQELLADLGAAELEEFSVANVSDKDQPIEISLGYRLDRQFLTTGEQFVQLRPPP